MAEKWANTSAPPSSGVMNPKPFSALNHFTTPTAMSSPQEAMEATPCGPRVTVLIFLPGQDRRQKERLAGSEVHQTLASQWKPILQRSHRITPRDAGSGGRTVRVSQ